MEFVHHYSDRVDDSAAKLADVQSANESIGG